MGQSWVCFGVKMQTFSMLGGLEFQLSHGHIQSIGSPRLRVKGFLGSGQCREYGNGYVVLLILWVLPVDEVLIDPYKPLT